MEARTTSNIWGRLEPSLWLKLWCQLCKTALISSQSPWFPHNSGAVSSLPVCTQVPTVCDLTQYTQHTPTGRQRHGYLFKTVPQICGKSLRYIATDLRIMRGVHTETSSWVYAVLGWIQNDCSGLFCSSSGDIDSSVAATLNQQIRPTQQNYSVIQPNTDQQYPSMYCNGRPSFTEVRPFILRVHSSVNELRAFTVLVWVK